MKKYSLKLELAVLPIILLICIRSSAQKDTYAGNVKISFYGFVCSQPTTDDGLGMDGVGDEVSVTFQTWGSVFDNKVGYPNINEVYGEDFLSGPFRVKAGTATVNGGIKAGDRYFRKGQYADKYPEMVATYDVAVGWAQEQSLIAILPAIWERDNDNPPGKAIGDFSIAANKAFNDQSVRQKMFNLRAQCDAYNESNVYAYLQQGNLLGVDNYFTGMFNGWRSKLLSHPIGMMTDGQFSSKVLLFTSKMLFLLSKKEFGYGPGIIPVVYDDEAVANTVSRGRYTILLKIVSDIKERQPAQPPVTQPPPMPIKTQKGITTTIVQPSYTMNNEFLAGTWSGTKGTSTSATDEPFSFRFNNNVFWLLNNQGVSIAAGSYQISNNNFLATCYDANNFKYEINSLSYSIATGELLGNWVCTGTGYYKVGKWITKKTSN